MLEPLCRVETRLACVLDPVAVGVVVDGVADGGGHGVDQNVCGVGVTNRVTHWVDARDQRGVGEACGNAGQRTAIGRVGPSGEAADGRVTIGGQGVGDRNAAQVNRPGVGHGDGPIGRPAEENGLWVGILLDLDACPGRVVEPEVCRQVGRSPRQCEVDRVSGREHVARGNRQRHVVVAGRNTGEAVAAVSGCSGDTISEI